MKTLGVMCAAVLLGTTSILLCGCDGRPTGQPPPEIAVTNSYLQCVVADLSGDDAPVLCLTPPGVCPGHFDISPAQVRQLRHCRILLLFDFQEKVADSLSRLTEGGLKTGLVKVPPALCVPETYVIACRQVCEILCSQYPQKEASYRERLAVIEKRLDKIARELLADVEQAGAKSARVLASERQRRFTDWLGMDTVATFLGSDVETASNIDHCLKQARGRDVRFVIANRQEGTALAAALAERLGAKAVVFSNFPERNVGALGFDGLVRANVQTLLEAAGR
jgi:zinc transport system substrate-binding protein